MTHYLVTGGAGFIGSHITHQLIDNHHRVRVLDNFSTGKEANLHGLNGELEIQRGDIRDIQVIRDSEACIGFIRTVPFCDPLRCVHERLGASHRPQGLSSQGSASKSLLSNQAMRRCNVMS